MWNERKMQHDTLSFALVGLLIGAGAALLYNGQSALKATAIKNSEEVDLSVRDSVLSDVSIDAQRQLHITVSAALSGKETAVPALSSVQWPRLRPQKQPSAHIIPATISVFDMHPGDTLLELLIRKGIPRGEAHAAIEALRPVYDPRDLKAGQKLALAVSHSASGVSELDPTEDNAEIDQTLYLQRIVFRPRQTLEISVVRNQHNGFVAEKTARVLINEPALAMGVIDKSLYLAGEEANLPPSVILTMTKPFGYDIDFQRDIHPGDRFIVLYERGIDPYTNVAVNYTEPLFVQLKVGNRTLSAYRFITDTGADLYFDNHGRDVRKTLLLTPIDGARISSGYGLRRHPILGYNKMHQGVDFAAPRGTPVYAAGDGIIEIAKRYGSYGKYIRVRHHNSSDYSTAYAHLHRFAKGIKKGLKVQQGDVIGYVGSTGRSTGPHLHYEVLRHGKQINPRQVKQTAIKSLKNDELVRFRNRKAEIDALIRRLTITDPIALAQIHNKIQKNNR